MSQPAVDRALLEVATKIVATEGVEALTVKRLARETGLSRATLYRFGTSREAILDALENSGTDVGGRAGSRERILAAAKEVFGRPASTRRRSRRSRRRRASAPLRCTAFSVTRTG